MNRLLKTYNFYKLFFHINRVLLQVETFLLISSLMILLLFAFLQVFLRNFFDSGINWGDVFNRLLVLWVAFFGASIAAAEKKHLSLEVLTKFLPKRLVPVTEMFVNSFVIVVTWMLTKHSYAFFQDQITFEASEVLFPGLPKAYFTIIFPIGFGLICFRYVVNMMDTVYRFAGGDEEFKKAYLQDQDSENSSTKKES